MICTFRRGNTASYSESSLSSNKQGHGWISACFHSFIRPVDMHVFAVTSTLALFSSEIWLCGWQWGVRLQPVQHILQIRDREKVAEKWPLHSIHCRTGGDIFIVSLSSFRWQKNISVIVQARVMHTHPHLGWLSAWLPCQKCWAAKMLLWCWAFL